MTSPRPVVPRPSDASSGVRHRPMLVRVGLPRDPRGGTHVAAFVVATMATVLLTRLALAASGYPQVGGGGLHVAHVLWGGLLMGVALVLAMTFAGPVVRPVVALVGGIGFGLFADEIGKFLTADNDYFFAPTPAIVYVVAIGLLLLGEGLQRRRRPHPSEQLAAAVDQAVAGVAGGFSARARARASALLDAADGAAGARETRALLDAVEPDPEEVPDVVAWVDAQVNSGAARLLASVRWLGVLVAVLVAVGAVASVGRGVLALAESDGPTWAAIGAIAGGVAQVALVVVGLVLRSSDTARAYRWWRRSVLVGLLVTQPFLFRTDEWAASIGLLAGLLLLVLVAAELQVLESRAGEGSAVG